MAWLFGAYIAIGVLYWLVQLIGAVRVVRSVPVLSKLQPAPAPRWPRVSVIIPACNEARSIEAAVTSRLQDDYPDLELILINDRSTDETGAIIDRLATRDPRVQTLRIRNLPPDWTGKVHAMQRGVELATGEWLLLSDADVHIVPGTLARCVALALERDLDHIAILPEMWRGTFWLDVVLAGFTRTLCVFGRFWAVADPRSSAAMGVGAFNLVRRSAYERTPGLQWLRLEIVDDAALAQMLKRAGARPALLNGRGLVGLHFYHSLWDMARGAEKSILSTVGRFSFARLILVTLLLGVFELAPFFGLFAPTPALRLLAGVGVLTAYAAQLIPWRWLNGRLLPVLFLPVAIVLSIGTAWRSGWLAIRRGGLLWRGTLYPLEQMRAGMRLKFP